MIKGTTTPPLKKKCQHDHSFEQGPNFHKKQLYNFLHQRAQDIESCKIDELELVSNMDEIDIKLK